MGIMETLRDYFELSRYSFTTLEFAEAFLNGTIRREYAKFQWTLGLGIPHPRGLRGCDFITSYEVTALKGFSFCDVGLFRSIRFTCPRSCGCLRMNNSFREWPMGTVKLRFAIWAAPWAKRSLCRTMLHHC